MKPMKINKPLIPLKIILFCWYGAASCLLPYQTIHMRQLGITVEETAIIYTFLPFTQILGPPIAGIIADRLGRYKPVLLINLILCIVFATITLLVPAIPPTVREPPDPTLQHTPEGGLQVHLRKCPDMDDCEHLPSGTPVRLHVSKCIYVCPKEYRTYPHQLREDEAVVLSKQYEVDQEELANNGTTELQFVDSGLPKNITLIVRLLRQRTPEDEDSERCSYSVHLVNSRDDERAPDHKYYEHYFLLYSKSALVHQQYNNFITNESKPSCVLSCPLTNVTYDKPSHPPVFNHQGCITEEPSRMVTFWLYFVIRILFQTVLNVCFSLLDATALALVEHHNSDFGRQRFWAILATAIFSPITGIAIDFISEYRKYEDYSPAYYFFDVLVICTTLFVGTLNIAVAPPEKNVLKNVCRLLRLPEVSAFMVVVFVLGTIWGFIESFLFWYLLDLGSPKYLLGLTLTASAIAGLPFLHESEWFVKKIGRVNLLIVALLVYFVRCFGYSYINNPWWCIPFEGMEAFTYHLMWVAAATYSANLVPKGLLATIQGCVGGLHFGVGRGAGSLVGGNIMHYGGARMAFRIMGIAGGVIGILYAVLYYTVLIKYKDVEETRKKQLEEELEKETRKSENETVKKLTASANEVEMESQKAVKEETVTRKQETPDSLPSEPTIENNSVKNSPQGNKESSKTDREEITNLALNGNCVTQV